jgi:hypothetical protein
VTQPPNITPEQGEWTKGPWSVGRDSNWPGSFGVIEGPSFAISYVLYATDVTFKMGEQRDRDARLIAAAPDMAAALMAVGAIRPSNWDDNDDPAQVAAWHALDAALSKATSK